MSNICQQISILLIVVVLQSSCVPLKNIKFIHKPNVMETRNATHARQRQTVVPITYNGGKVLTGATKV
jgi:hypothetical protein